MSKDAGENVPSDEMTSSELVALGKRNMACHDVNNAVLCYARACSKIAKEHGPLSEELAVPSYLYGKALLETARLEASVLGGTLPEEEGPSSSSDEEEEADQSDVKESEVGLNHKHDTTNGTNTEDNNQSRSSSHDQEECSSHNPVESSCDQSSSSHDQGEHSHDQKEHLDSQKEDSHVQEGSSNDQEGSSHDQEGSSHDQGEGSRNQEDNQEVTGLQLAWEVLELSRVILSKQDTREAKLQTADIMATLGEIGLESDMFDQAIKDFSASLEIKESLLPNHDRAIAELQFQLGLAYTLVKDFDSAILAYQKAKNVLKGRIEHLHSVIADETVTEKEQHQKEIKDLEELLPDLDSKIEDVSDAKKEMLNSVMSCIQDEAGSSSGFGACSSASVSKAPATDISHLVRKRPVARDGTQPDTDAKRSKQEETSSVDITTASEQ